MAASFLSGDRSSPTRLRPLSILPCFGIDTQNDPIHQIMHYTHFHIAHAGTALWNTASSCLARVWA